MLGYFMCIYYYLSWKFILYFLYWVCFLRASGPGDTLYAEARERYIGRSTGCYQVDITNQNGDLIATFESSVFRKDQKVPFTL